MLASLLIDFSLVNWSLTILPFLGTSSISGSADGPSSSLVLVSVASCSHCFLGFRGAADPTLVVDDCPPVGDTDSAFFVCESG